MQLSLILNYIILIGATILLLYEPIIQIQLLIFKSIIFKPSMYFLLFILSIIVFSYLIIKSKFRIKTNIPKHIIFISIIWIFISLSSLILNIIKGNFGINYYINSYFNLFYYLLLSIILIITHNYRINRNIQKSFFYIITCIGIVLIVFGLAQYITNDPIVPLIDPETGKSTVSLWNFYGKIRIFSLFKFPGNFGLVCVFLTMMWISYFIYGEIKKIYIKIVFILLIGLGIYSVYICYIRTSLLLLILSMIGFILIKNRVSPNKIVFTSIFICLLISIIYLFLVGKEINTGGLLDNASLIDRFELWKKLIDTYILNKDSTFNIVFGSTVVNDSSYGLNIPIDNYYISVFIYGGIFGLISWIAVNISIIKYSIKKAITTNSIYWKVAGSILFGSPTIFLLATLPQLPYVVLIYALIMDRFYKSDTTEKLGENL